MDDIEDLQVEGAADGAQLRLSEAAPRVAINAGKTNPAEDVPTKGGDPLLPGNQNVFLKVWGCSHNVSDKEYMAGILLDYGYRIVESDDAADVAILVSCTVKNPSEGHFLTYLEKLKEKGVKVIAAGCVPQGESKHPKLQDVSLIGTQQIDRIVEVVEQSLQGNVVRLMSMRKRPELDLPKVRKNKYIEIVPINTGCLNSCTYCKTKHARGKLGSYTVESIVDRVVSVVQEGVTEIWLTSEDTGAYGRDIKSSISVLLRAILAAIEKYPHVMLKVGMTNPPYIVEHIDTVCEVLNHPQVYSIIHIPIQSGSNKILGLMKREYTVEEFSYLVETLRKNVPGVTVATDIICGFPYETDEDFQMTHAVVDKFRFAVMNTTQFYPRPGTPAAKMPKVNSQVVKNRTRVLTSLFESLDPYRDMIGTVQRVWSTGEMAKDKVHLVGHTKNYVQVLLPYDAKVIGKSATVEITGCSRYSVTAKYVAEPKSA
ncbi:unnamed protein product, partial [Ectocarpus fasciculatus]